MTMLIMLIFQTGVQKVQKVAYNIFPSTLLYVLQQSLVFKINFEWKHQEFNYIRCIFLFRSKALIFAKTYFLLAFLAHLSEIYI